MNPIFCDVLESWNITEVFELFDVWDGRDRDVDASKVGDMCFCLGLNPTQTIQKNAGTTKLGEKLSDAQVDEIIKATDTREDLEGNVKYKDFTEKVIKGPEV